MHRSRQSLSMISVLLIGSGAICGVGLAESSTLRVGFAQGDITPKITEEEPVWIAGYGQNRSATGVHDPLFCRAVVLDDGRRRLALVSVDLVGLQYPVVLKIRSRLAELDYVLVTSTHNHQGPDVIGLWGPSPLRSGVDRRYVEQVVDRVVQTVRQAAANTVIARALYGTATDEALLRDARLPIVHDSVLRAVRFTAAKSPETVGLLVQWNCHPESLGSRNRLITADFPFATVGALERHYDCPVVYFTGAIGGLLTNPRTIRTLGGKEVREGTFEYAETYGRAVSRLAQQAADAAKPISLSPLTVSARPVMIPLANPLYQAGRALGLVPREALVWSNDFEKLGPPATAKTPVQKLAIKTEVAYLRLGEMHVAGIPGEIYPELVYGEFQDPVDPQVDFPDAPLEPAVMDLLPGKRTLLVGMANDEVGYIIPKRQWDRKSPFAYGRKESQYGEVNSCGPDTAPVLMEALRRRVHELQSKDDLEP